MDRVLADLGEVNKELARFAALEMSYDRLSPRAKDLLLRTAVSQKAFPYEAMEWVMGKPDEKARKKEIEKVFKKVRADEKYKDWSDDDIRGALERQILEIREAKPFTDELNELIHWGLAVRLPDRDEEWYQVHSLVKEFCKDKVDEEVRNAHLKDAAAFYLNEGGKYPDDSPQAVFLKLDGRHLLFEAEDFDSAGNIINNISEILHRFGFITLVERLLQETIDNSSVKIQSGAVHNLGIVYHDQGDYAKALDQYKKSLKIAEALGNKAGIANSLHQIGMILHAQQQFAEAFDRYLPALFTLAELGSPDAKIAANSLRKLRKDWGAKHFDQAWQEKTGQPVPDGLKEDNSGKEK